jgi:REP element-mobilizing transposase RayT
MRWLESATANRANALLGQTRTAFWQREYFDRWIRSEQELAAAIRYVEENPVRGRLVSCPEEWPWSSARETPATRSPALPASQRRQ